MICPKKKDVSEHYFSCLLYQQYLPLFCPFIYFSLEELHLSLNHYTSVDLLPDLLYPSLVRLFFNGNKVCVWSEINKLGRAFPSLQQLFLAETELRTLDETDCMAESFPCLSLLSLNKTQLEGWDILERLRLLPSLIDVRLQGIPFLEVTVVRFSCSHFSCLLSSFFPWYFTHKNLCYTFQIYRGLGTWCIARLCR